MKARHGGDIIAVARELGCRLDELADMSGNLSPLGVDQRVVTVLSESLGEIAFLPEGESRTLCASFAGLYGRGEEEVIAGNGTTEFIFGLPAALRPRRAVIVQPTYADYRLACEWAGVAEIEEYTLAVEEDFSLDCGSLAERLGGGELVFICNLNNPTGVLVSSLELHGLAAARPDCRFVVDEAYLPFTREPSLLELPPLANLLVMNTFSKIYCIPGLRLGFLTGGPGVVKTIRRRTKPWGVNRLAQIAGEYICNNYDELRSEVLAFLDHERPAFERTLAAIPGIETVKGSAIFLLARITDGRTAEELRLEMLNRKIIIRNCRDFPGLDESYFRISLKDQVTNQRCLAALSAIMGGA